MQHEDRSEIILLPPPDLRPSQEVGFNTGLRPYRFGGIRVEAEHVKGKIVVHNYGHGGGGVSLFFGSCMQAFEKFEESLAMHACKGNTINVLGSG